MREITIAQELHLKLMELVSFNNLNGPLVVAGLRANLDLWDGAIMVDERGGILILRDLPGNYNIVCTLYITTQKPEEIEKLARQWGADEFDHWRRGDGDKDAPDDILYMNDTTTTLCRLWWD